MECHRGQVELGLALFNIFIYDPVEGTRNIVMKCSDANKFTNIANTRENRGLRPTGGQKENGFPLERATRRNMGETLEAVMLKSPRTY